MQESNAAAETSPYRAIAPPLYQGPPRTCGACRMCCKVMGVYELEKPADQWCPSLSLERGCTVYDQRPHSCRVFVCGWLQGVGDDDYRPDRSRVIFTFTSEPSSIVFEGRRIEVRTPALYEARDGAALKGRMGQWVMRAAARGLPIIVQRMSGRRWMSIAPGGSSTAPTGETYNNPTGSVRWGEFKSLSWAEDLAEWRRNNGGAPAMPATEV